MKNSASVQFLYGTAPGRILLKGIQQLHLDRIAVWFLRSSLSKAIIPWYIRTNQIPMERYQEQKFGSFRDFFLREKKNYTFDADPEHLISPCDGFLSVFPVEENQGFSLKGSYYRVQDLIHDPETAALFTGGQCLVFRLCASDYHHYCYIDDGNLKKSGFIEGKLHSVQPIACETYPVFSLNRRAWSLLQTVHFGPVVQTEIGALVVGGIVNNQTEGTFSRGEKKGRFELSGSTIVLFLQKGAISLRPEILEILKQQPEARVELGMWIGSRLCSEPSEERVPCHKER